MSPAMESKKSDGGQIAETEARFGSPMPKSSSSRSISASSVPKDIEAGDTEWPISPHSASSFSNRHDFFAQFRFDPF